VGGENGGRLVLLFAVLLTIILITGLLGRRERLQALAELPVRHLWLAPVALALQLPLIRAPATATASGLFVSRVAFLASYLLLGWVLWLNRRLPGIPWLAAGVFLNGLAIVANGGWMPIAPQTVVALGGGAWPLGTHHGTSKDVVLPLGVTRLWFLSDIFVIPKPFPWPTAFSIGDILIAVGVARFSWSGPPSKAEGKQKLCDARNAERVMPCIRNNSDTPS
jgi:hypothetical protein